MKNIIMSGFIEKNYSVTPEDFFVQIQVRYSPVFRFVWRVRVRAYDVDILLDLENIFSQIPELGQRSRNDASSSTDIRVDMSDILTDNITPDIKKQLGYDHEDFSHTNDTTTREASLLTLTVDLVKLVIKFSKN